MNVNRRHLLVTGGLILAGGYVHQRGLRYPRLGFEPRPLQRAHQTPSAELRSEDCILTASDLTAINLRAYNPEPQITLTVKQPALTLRLNNVSEQAQLKVDAPSSAKIAEQINGINREIEIRSNNEEMINLGWHLTGDEFDFAIIGDTGGNVELDWCIKRANELNATFLLHLGDFNYAEGEYQRAIEQFYDSPIPIYVSIGNHDFNTGGLIYDQFLAQIGPFNHSFNIADTRFINLDTAADFFPAHSGNRGRLTEQLLDDQRKYSDTVVFTHRVIKDPRPNEDHVIGGLGEIAWLCDSIKELGGDTLLTGHVHHSAELNYNGIRQFTAGEGLGHEDIVHKKQVSKILMGTASKGKKVSYQWQPLKMPWLSHQSPTHITKLMKYKRFEQLEWFQTLLKQTTS